MNSALQGITVIDLTRVLAGPYCTMFLADMGANVIKVEVPGKGDDTRTYAPSFHGESAYFINLNRNKRSLTLNLKSAKGKQILTDLVKKADILIENFRPGTMEKLGLGYDVLKEVNPKLVYGCISGFGQYGPYHDRPGYDIVAQAMGGLMSITGWPGGSPTRSGTAIGDVLAGLSLTIGVEAAYINAQKTGVGQMVDVALVDSVVSSLEVINQIYLASGRIPERIGNRYEATAPYDSFHAKDGDMVIAAGNNKLFALLCGVFMALLYFFSPNTSPVEFYVCSAIAWFFFSGFNTAIYAIIPDCVEYGEWKTGVRNDGFQYAFVSLANKMGMALGTAMFALALDSAGYVAGAEQNADVIAIMRHTFSTIPGALWVITAFCLCFYKLHRNVYNKIVDELKAIKNKVESI